jgi:hypothetical protein
MDKKVQLAFLKGKFDELSRQYITVLQTGKSLQQIKDFSYVLECLRSEIQMLETELSREEQPGSTVSS